LLISFLLLFPKFVGEIYRLITKFNYSFIEVLGQICFLVLFCMFAWLIFSVFTCFVIGFFGPIAFAKDTSQGPLIGLFIAAPLGVIMGAIGGYLYVSRQNGADG